MNARSLSLRLRYIVVICSLGLSFSLVFGQDNPAAFTRGVGVYPGDPREDFSPSAVIDDATYRNLALHRAARHSSSYDYNLTAQLITDGIRDTLLPAWIALSTNQHGILPRQEREWLIDHNVISNLVFDGAAGWIQVDWYGGAAAPWVDGLALSANLVVNDRPAAGWQCRVMGSDDGRTWTELGRIGGNDYPGDTLPRRSNRPGPNRVRLFNQPVHWSPARHRHYRVEFNAPNATRWTIGELSLLDRGQPVEIAPSHTFTSAWMSAGSGEEWVYVDLGARCTFDRLVLSWIRRAARGVVQVSDDASSWRDLKPLPIAGLGLTDELRFEPAVAGRYVRLLLQQAGSAEGYILSEMEVYGRGGPVVQPHPAPAYTGDGRLALAGGKWTVQRASLVKDDGAALSTADFADEEWLPATVPGTVLVSYLNAGALPDPNFGDNQLMISESFFNADFWYRNEFELPAGLEGQHLYLNFDGINWKADVYFNGHRLGRIEGAFTRGRFDISDLLLPGQPNALAVRIEKNATPGNVKEQTAASPDKNGGALGADNPTFHASIGWDWIPTIRGRNAGIWNDVYLSVSGPVTIENPFVTTDLPLPDTSQADLRLEVTLHNHQAMPVNGILRGTFGTVAFEQAVDLRASEVKTITLDPATHPALRLQRPRLWWPNGYGEQNLYTVALTFETPDRQISDSKKFQTGVREMTYSEEGDALKIWVNGRRFVGRGGNWGFSESMLRYRAREYDIAVGYHQDMNFTLIRNWVGQIGDDEFFEACDRHGIMIWQDFWLANPVDGPNPDDNALFMANAEDFVRRIRNHPSLALYCGRNEGNPPQELDDAIRAMLPRLHPGLYYISHSAVGPVSGFGPYRTQPAKFYFEQRATPKLHSELGMPNIVTYESLQAMMPDSIQLPPGRLWGLHDFCLNGAQGGASFLELFDKRYGPVASVKEWVDWAQWMNYEGYRAMYEAQGKNRMGLVIWMSHPAWPSMVWQTYDYYFEPTAAYFACKKASEPLHIQWNPASDSIEVVNYSHPTMAGLSARVELRNLDGSLKWEKSVTLDSPEDSVVPCIDVAHPADLSSVYFLRLYLHKGDALLSENFYWLGQEEDNYRAVRAIPAVKLDHATQVVRQGGEWVLTTRLRNPSPSPALMVRLEVVGAASGERLLPAWYSDNYVSLMPGEERLVRMTVRQEDTREEQPAVVVSGVNVNE